MTNTATLYVRISKEMKQLLKCIQYKFMFKTLADAVEHVIRLGLEKLAEEGKLDINECHEMLRRTGDVR